MQVCIYECFGFANAVSNHAKKRNFQYASVNNLFSKL